MTTMAFAARYQRRWCVQTLSSLSLSCSMMPRQQERHCTYTTKRRIRRPIDCHRFHLLQHHERPAASTFDSPTIATRHYTTSTVTASNVKKSPPPPPPSQTEATSSNSDVRQHYIFGRWIQSSSSSHQDDDDDNSLRKSLLVENPSTHETLARIPRGTAQDAEWALQAAETVQPTWELQCPPTQRAQILQQLADALVTQSTQLSRIISEEQGSTMALAQAEVEASADYLRYCASLAAPGINGTLLPGSSGTEQIQLHRVPRGVVAALFLSSSNNAATPNQSASSNPWPLRGMMQVLGPALVTGNTLVIKPSSPLTALALAQIMDDIIPPGVVNVVVGNDDTLCTALAEHPSTSYIRCITTESLEEDATAQTILNTAAQRAIPVVLQSGGSAAPAVVWDDCDLPTTVQHLWSSRTLFGAGQVPCYTPHPIYVVTTKENSSSSFYDEFVQALMQKVEQTKVGRTPNEENIDMCGLMHATQLHKLAAWVQQARNGGAKVETGGNINTQMSSGYHYQPTVLTNLPENMRQQQVLGPVWSVVKLEQNQDWQDVLLKGHGGPSASLFTANATVIQKVMSQGKFGTVFVNRDPMPANQGYHSNSLGGTDGELGLMQYTTTRCIYWNMPDTKAK